MVAWLCAFSGEQRTNSKYALIEELKTWRLSLLEVDAFTQYWFQRGNIKDKIYPSNTANIIRISPNPRTRWRVVDVLRARPVGLRWLIDLRARLNTSADLLQNDCHRVLTG
jgi:hypothetical protein